MPIDLLLFCNVASLTMRRACAPRQAVPVGTTHRQRGASCDRPADASAPASGRGGTVWDAHLARSQKR
jgi:hypothetical protein